MKKLLNLFAGITLVTTGVSTVVACNNNESKTNDEDKVDSIINKLKKTDVVVDPGSETNVNNPNTLAQIISALKNQNNLSSIEAQAISFLDPPTLKSGIKVVVQATVKYGNVSKTVKINILLAEDLKQQIQAFKDKINPTTPISIDASADDPTISDNKKLENPNYHTKAIKSALLVNNPGLTVNELNKITNFSSPALVLGTTVTVTADFKFKDSLGRSEEGQVSFQVIRAENDLDRAKAIANKIVNRNIFVPNNTSEVTANSNIIQALAKAPNNNALTTNDQQNISTNAPYDLQDGIAKQINAIITVGTEKFTIPLTVTKRTTAYENAENIKKRIPSTGTSQQSAINISADDLSGGTPVSPGSPLKEYDASDPHTGVQTAINRGLQTKSNNQITASDIQNITYTGTIAEKPDITHGPQATTLTGTIKYPGSTSQSAVTFKVNVYIANDNFTKGDALRDKINVRNYDIGLVPDLNVSHEGTSAQLRNIVKKDNKLKDAEASQIYFDPKQLVPGSSIAVSMNIARGRIIIPLQVKVFQSALQYVSTIQKLFVNGAIQLFGSNDDWAGKSTSDDHFIAFLERKLQDPFLKFTPDMFQIIKFQSSILKSDSNNTIKVIIGNGTATFGVEEESSFDLQLS